MISILECVKSAKRRPIGASRNLVSLFFTLHTKKLGARAYRGSKFDNEAAPTWPP